jgi:hypothetical protein
VGGAGRLRGCRRQADARPAHRRGPEKFAPEDSTEVYGGGAFLLAGSEVYRMAVLENWKPIAIKITNPSNFHRDCETVEVDEQKLVDLFEQMEETPKIEGDFTGPPIGMFNMQVMDGLSSRILDSQVLFHSITF